ncbi:MAG TPA: metallophosphoesterase [Blastocatellia bacterium]|nr:metallophosphoesterase [Blastocatellia bacterium]
MAHTHRSGDQHREVARVSNLIETNPVRAQAVKPKEVVNTPRSWLETPKRLAYRLSKVLFDGSGMALSVLAKLNIEGRAQEIDTTAIQIEIAGLPEQFHGIRIAQISDIHFGSFLAHEGMERLIELTRSLRPDLILLTGDYVNRWVSEVKQVIPMLGRLEAPLGVYAVLGNHDFYADAEETVNLLSRHGIKHLDHDSECITVGGSNLWLLGSGDYVKDRRYDLNKRLAKVPKEEPRIVMAHNPDTADLPRSHRVDLMLCGHTHGGQIRVPGRGALILPIYNRNYDQGLFRLNDMQLFVSRGLGMVGLPFRINCAPQLPILQLVTAHPTEPS